MKVLLSHPRVLHNGKAESAKHYGKGQHDIADDVAEHWFTQAMMKSGDISVIAEPKAAKKEDAAKDESKDKSKGSSK